MSKRMKFDDATSTMTYVNACDVCNVPESMRPLIADEWTGNHICDVCAQGKWYLKGFEGEEQ